MAGHLLRPPLDPFDFWILSKFLLVFFDLLLENWFQFANRAMAAHLLHCRHKRRDLAVLFSQEAVEFESICHWNVERNDVPFLELIWEKSIDGELAQTLQADKRRTSSVCSIFVNSRGLVEDLFVARDRQFAPVVFLKSNQTIKQQIIRFEEQFPRRFDDKNLDDHRSSLKYTFFYLYVC